MTQIDMIEDDERLESANYRHSELTEVIIKAFFKVYNTLATDSLRRFMRMQCFTS